MNKKKKRIPFLPLAVFVITVANILLFLLRQNTQQLIFMLVNITVFVTVLIFEILSIKLTGTGIDEAMRNENEVDEMASTSNRKLGLFMMLSAILVLVALGIIIASIILFFL